MDEGMTDLDASSGWAFREGCTLWPRYLGIALRKYYGLFNVRRDRHGGLTLALLADLCRLVSPISGSSGSVAAFLFLDGDDVSLEGAFSVGVA